MKKSVIYELGRIHSLPGKLVKWALGLDKKVELILDSCPLGFDFTEAGRIRKKKRLSRFGKEIDHALEQEFS